MAHALLSPSSASRWLACTPSARLESTMPDSAGQAAAEGTLAHALAELKLRRWFREITPQKFNVELKQIEKNELYSADMLSYVEDYALFVKERVADAKAATKHATVALETKLDLTKWVPEGFGTGDCIIIADGTLEIIDLKFGKGVLVDATANKQMMLYALGALEEFSFLYDIETIRMTIYQPRLENYSSYELTSTELRAWADSELKPRAALAFAGKGDFIPGDHCRFCKVRATCRALADYNLQLAEYDFGAPELLNEAEVADILERAAAFKSWIGSVEDYALNEALKGKTYPGYKLVEGRSNRTYKDDTEVAKALKTAGWEAAKIYQPAKLLGVTAMEKLLTKGGFNAILGAHVVKPPGKPTLVPQTDKRPPLNSSEAAAADFATCEVEDN